MASLAENLEKRHAAASSEAGARASSPESTDTASKAVSASSVSPEPHVVVSEPVTPNKLDGMHLPTLRGTGSSELPTLRRGTRPSWIDEVTDRSSSSSAPATPAANSSPRVELVTLADIGSNAAETVLDIQKRIGGIQIEASKAAPAKGSTGSGPTTFMIRGAPAKITAAAEELRARLGPRTTVSLRIPVQARSVVLGPKGQALHQLENQTHTRVDLGQAKKRPHWDIETIEITVTGAEGSVENAAATLKSKCERSIGANRTLPNPHMGPLVLWSLGDNVDARLRNERRVLEVRGNWFEQIADVLDAVDKQIDSYEASYILEAAPRTRLLTPEQTATLAGVVVTYENDLYGSPEAVAAASAKVEKLLSGVSHASLDISKAHSRDLPHAQLLARYFDASGEIDRLESRLGVRIVRNASTNGVVYDIVGEAGAVSLAKNALIGHVNALKPASVAEVGPLTVPVTRTAAQAALKKFSAPSIKAALGSDALFLAYESDEDFGASEEELAKAVQDAVAFFSDVAVLAKEVVTRTVELPITDVKLVRDPAGESARKLSAAVLDPAKVSIEYVPNGAKTTVTLYGKRADVGKAAATVPEIVALSKEYGRKASYMEELPFDQDLVRKLIGRSGTQISKIRAQFPDVRIDVSESGRVRLTGIESQVHAARQHILDIQKRLRDEITVELRVPVQFHAILIGQRGKNVRRLSEKHNCMVRFPREDREDASPESEPTSSQTGNADDIIIIRGPSKGVTAIRKEFTELVDYERAVSHSRTLKVPQSVLPRVIGRHGANINAIMSETGVQIDIPSKVTDEPSDDFADVVIVGEKAKVDEAAALVMKTVDGVKDHTDREITIDQKYHRYLTGSGNSIRRQIVLDAGGEVEPWNPRTLAIPPSSAKLNTIKLSGPSKLVDAMEARIRAIVAEHESRSRCTLRFTVPQAQHRVVVGPSGTTKREIERKFNVHITVPRPADNSEEVTISGANDEIVNAAKDYIVGLSTLAETTVEIPVSFETDLWARGAFSRRLNQELNVRVSREGSATPAAKSPRPTRPSEIKQYAFIKETTNVAEGSPRRTWRISGRSKENCEQAKQLIEAKCASYTIAWLWLPEASQYKQLVGPGGHTINRIRGSTGCSVTIPAAGSSNDEAVVLEGSEDEVDAAKTELLAAVGL